MTLLSRHPENSRGANLDVTDKPTLSFRCLPQKQPQSNHIDYQAPPPIVNIRPPTETLFMIYIMEVSPPFMTLVW